MGLLDKFKKKNKQPFPMNGPNFYNSYQQPYQNLQNPYGARPNFDQRYPYPQTPQQPYQQHQQQFYPPVQQIIGQQGHYHQPIAYQPQLNAHQQYISQNKILQPVPFQNQPVMQAQGSGNFQQQGSQNQYPMTGQPPEKDDDASPGFFSRLMGGDTSITGVIGSMQKAVQAAQQVTPMIQQYAPAIKNFPSIYKIFKAVNTDDPIDTKKSKNEANGIIDVEQTQETKTKKRKKAPIKSEEVEPSHNIEETASNVNPKPKLFM
ncbi:VrrA/YqfQ family protein [Gottfriedia acidiceleris]|uniref:VrrA/YqfQ family protein n=1 Tax=Gottfriedia acidiceleris TaxID=371036 RepID=UPI00101C8C1A|nr:VrrA/YqfQ family protein [Gottfriedia acidiceleris]